MKRFKLRIWVKVVLIIIAVLSGLVMMSDCEDTTIFVLSHLIATGIFVLTTTLLAKYGH